VTIRPEDLRGEAADAYRMWRTVFNLSESAALNAVAQDGLVEQDGFDRTASVFRSIFGLSAEQARTAVVGRQSVSEAQRFWGSSGGSSTDIRDPHLRLATEALARMSDAEVDQMLAEEQAKRKAAKKTTSSGGSVKKQTTVSERGSA
jgi:hypothetical protein